MFDPTKPVRTRDGRQARIIATDAKTDRSEPVIALIDNGHYEEVIHVRSDGMYLNQYYQHCKDLVNVPQEKWTWVHANGLLHCHMYDTKQAAQTMADGFPGNTVVKIIEE